MSERAPDGSPVALYARLPSLGEPERSTTRFPAGRRSSSPAREPLEGGHVSGEMEYLVDGRRLVHAFESRLLTDDELDDDLRSVGLRRVRELDERGSWIEAAPIAS